ncbi:IS110 family transposase [Streptosporangium sp. NPDC005286]|uniref:IS110 family transposase n=1 Tax=Streptosporangium sp. NPDC005286 TaxID=3154463 RepID=UPI00339E0A56
MLFIGDDWAEDHHDVELQDEAARRLARARLPEGVTGIARLHELVARHLSEDAEPDQVVIGIETDRGPWVQALIAAGYQVYALNPLKVARYREQYGVSGAKSDVADAHVPAEIVRKDRHQHRPVAGDSDQAAAVQVVARSHQTLIWERTRTILRLRHALREYFPAALEAFGDLAGADTLELLARASDPESAAALSRSQIMAALKRARRRDVEDKAAAIQAVLRGEYLRRPGPVTAAYAVVVRSLAAVIATLNAEIKNLEEQVKECFGQARDAEIYLSQPGMGQIVGARALGEFGDDETRYASAKNRKNYAGTSPITKQSGKKKTVLARFIRNRRLADALHQQAFSALKASPGARAYYDELRERGEGHHAALRKLSNRLVGILHGCLKDGTPYDEAVAWSHRTEKIAA